MRVSIVLTLTLLLAAPAWGAVKFRQSAERIDVEIDGKPFTTFYFGADAPKPYFHPLRAADGTIVTRGYPMENIPGESQDHPHHRGLWFTHGDVNGLDFWANEITQKPREKKGKVMLKGVHKAGDGFIRADFEWQTPDGEVLLTEERTVYFRSGPGLRIMDFDIHLKAEIHPVKFGDTKEGTFAVRVAAPMREKDRQGNRLSGVITRADGTTGEKNVWGTRSPWMDYSGAVDGKNVGIAIFDHPGNPKHPTYWHVRSYGLFAANIFGEHDFHRDESRDGSVTLQPGESMRFRYRVVVHDGDAESAGVARLYKEYSGH